MVKKRFVSSFSFSSLCKCPSNKLFIDKLLHRGLRLIPAAVYGREFQGSPVGPQHSRGLEKNVSKPKCTLTKVSQATLCHTTTSCNVPFTHHRATRVPAGAPGSVELRSRPPHRSTTPVPPLLSQRWHFAFISLALEGLWQMIRCQHPNLPTSMEGVVRLSSSEDFACELL